MRIVYTVPFTRELLISDHWTIPVQGGACRVIEEKGRAKALEIVFTGQPVAYAPSFENQDRKQEPLLNANRDAVFPLIKRQLDAAVAFLSCYFEVGLNTEEIETRYEGETPEEEREISVKSFGTSRHNPPLPLAFNLLTRALMAAETSDGPGYESSLVSMARDALFHQQFINSFRYSFLLIESLYGDGQFKSSRLKSVLKGNADFVTIVDQVLKEGIGPTQEHISDTSKLLSGSPDASEVIDHIVDKRGFYFHGNVKHRNAWRPDQQQGAKTLAVLTINIAQRISQRAASPMFDDSFTKRHVEDAKKAGAEIVFQIKYKFREPGEKFQREHILNVNTPGTKATSFAVLAITKEFFRHFEHNFPVAALDSAECKLQGSDELVFNMQFHTKD